MSLLLDRIPYSHRKSNTKTWTADQNSIFNLCLGLTPDRQSGLIHLEHPIMKKKNGMKIFIFLPIKYRHKQFVSYHIFSKRFYLFLDEKKTIIRTRIDGFSNDSKRRKQLFNRRYYISSQNCVALSVQSFHVT